MFGPPPAERLPGLLTSLERFIHAPKPRLPLLVRIGLVHAQFETIHSFLDGNGRLGRLLIGALIEQWGLLPEPLLYPSGYLKQHQAEYYRRLSAIRTTGDREGWIGFFLEGVSAAAADAEHSIIAVARLVAADRRRLLDSSRGAPTGYRLFEMLPTMPRFTVEQARQKPGASFPTANLAVKVLEALGIVTEMTGQKTNGVYSDQADVKLLMG